MQFIETARELEIYTIKQCARFPKRFMFLIMKDIVALAKAVYNNVKAANSVYPTNAAVLNFSIPKGDKGDDGKTPSFSVNENGELIATFE